MSRNRWVAWLYDVPRVRAGSDDLPDYTSELGVCEWAFYRIIRDNDLKCVLAQYRYQFFQSFFLICMYMLCASRSTSANKSSYCDVPEKYTVLRKERARFKQYRYHLMYRA
jgi:hypothetical protein